MNGLPEGHSERGQGLGVSGVAKALAGLAVFLALVANVLGYSLDLYGRFWWFDRVLHAGTLFAITLSLAVLVFAPSLREGFRFRTFILVLCIGISLGALWEVAEWAYDQYAPGDVIKGKFDTVLDLIMDTIGAALAAMLCNRLWR